MQLLLPFAALARLKPGARVDLTAGLLLGKKHKIVVAVVSISSTGQILFVQRGHRVHCPSAASFSPHVASWSDTGVGRGA